MATDRNLISVAQAAVRLGLKEATVRKYVRIRHIPYVKIGSCVLFDPERLDRWIAQHVREPMGASA